MLLEIAIWKDNTEEKKPKGFLLAGISQKHPKMFEE
jgi:hypothetical protein